MLRINEKIKSVIIGGMEDVILVLTVYLVFLWVGLPGMEAVPEILLTPAGVLISFIVIFLIGGFSGYMAYFVYQKLKDTNVVRRIQGESNSK